jgi:hypothetical protein
VLLALCRADGWQGPAWRPKTSCWPPFTTRLSRGSRLLQASDRPLIHMGLCDSDYRRRPNGGTQREGRAVRRIASDFPVAIADGGTVIHRAQRNQERFRRPLLEKAFPQDVITCLVLTTTSRVARSDLAGHGGGPRLWPLHVRFSDVQREMRSASATTCNRGYASTSLEQQPQSPEENHRVRNIFREEQLYCQK